MLAAGWGEGAAAFPALARREDEAGGQEGLVVGVGPDAEQGAGHDRTSTTIATATAASTGRAGLRERQATRPATARAPIRTRTRRTGRMVANH